MTSGACSTSPLPTANPTTVPPLTQGYPWPSSPRVCAPVVWHHAGHRARVPPGSCALPVSGVVRDVSTLAESAYAQVWIPFTSTDQVDNTWNNGLMGVMSCTILAKDRADFPAIREECNRRLEAYNQSLAEEGWKFISRNRPYDQEKHAIAMAANWEPDVKAARRERWVIFLILLIVPAINLSSMTQSRLRRRVSEIGVRRAFGCTRRELVGQILGENLIVTPAAGAVGWRSACSLPMWATRCSSRRSTARHSIRPRSMPPSCYTPPPSGGPCCSASCSTCSATLR